MGQPADTSISDQLPNSPVDDAFDAYALAVGKVAYAWNFLQERLGQLFGVILGGGPHHSIATAVWYSSDSDRMQQRMLRAAVTASPVSRWPIYPKARDDLLWLLKEADALIDYRNNAVHTPMAVWIGGAPTNDPKKEFERARADQSLLEIGPVAYRGHPRARGLVGKRLLEQFDWCEQRASALSGFSHSIEIALSGDGQFPWPKRPRLPART